jgi:hypothetical protein
MKTEPRNISCHFTSHEAITETASRPRVSALPAADTDASLICRYLTEESTRRADFLAMLGATSTCHIFFLQHLMWLELYGYSIETES